MGLTGVPEPLYRGESIWSGNFSSPESLLLSGAADLVLARETDWSREKEPDAEVE